MTVLLENTEAELQKTLNIAVIGAGRWGPNLIRNFHSHSQSQVRIICDQDPTRLEALGKHYEGIETASDWQYAVSHPDVKAVVICTPTVTHYAISKKALELGKHVFVEKPITTKTTEALALAELAKEKQCKLMVGHVFVFNPAVKKIKQILDVGDLGQLHYLHATRTNLGPIRADVNALWDLAPHDISMLLYLLGEKPNRIQGFGGSFINPPNADVGFVWLGFPSGVLAKLHVSWLDPKKVRQLVIVGSRKMLVFDDMAPKPLAVFDKNVGTVVSDTLINDTIHHFRKSIVEGNVTYPEIEISEPLENECRAFVDWVVHDKVQPSTAEMGAEVVRILEKATESAERPFQAEEPVESKRRLKPLDSPQQV